jgi:hypothetical protein
MRELSLYVKVKLMLSNVIQNETIKNTKPIHLLIIFQFNVF